MTKQFTAQWIAQEFTGATSHRRSRLVASRGGYFSQLDFGLLMLAAGVLL